MLKSIRLKNVKGHENSTFNLSPGLNVICGDTDSGKSTVSRAFNWLITNQRGYNPRPWKKLKPKGESSITVETLEGQVIERVKHTGINGYKLDGEVFKALGSDVPEEIKDALRMKDINLQPQKNAYYLLNETGGAVAKEFNKIANLENMDMAISKIQSRKVEKAGEIVELEGAMEKTTEKIQKLGFITMADQELQILEKRRKDIDLLNDRLKTVKTCSITITEVQSKMVPSELFSSLPALISRKIDRSKVVTVRDSLFRVDSVKLIPNNFFEDFNVIYEKDTEAQRTASRFLNNSKLVKQTKIPRIPRSLFEDLDYIKSVDISSAKLRGVRSLVSKCAPIDGSKLASAMVELSAKKALIKVCSECGRML